MKQRLIQNVASPLRMFHSHLTYGPEAYPRLSSCLQAFADRTDDRIILVSPLQTGGWKDGT